MNDPIARPGATGTPRPVGRGVRGGEGALGAIATWLLVVAALVFVMIVLGGITRLTESGLSMVEWRPVTGWLPPLSHEGWEKAFAAYKAFPEYQKINFGMSLADFQTIYWFEYSHRLLGRLIGIAFALPFIYFLVRRAVPGWLVPRLVGLFVLGGLQGAVGWFMVQSGLVDRPDVSQYRLAMHLGLAFLIFAGLFWTALNCLHIRAVGGKGGAAAPPGRDRRGARLAGLFLLLVFVQILAGALVAGINAGMTYNTWPLMDGRLIPNGLDLLSPGWLNLFENVTTVQFQHRVIGYLVLAMALLLWWQARGGSGARSAALVLASVVLQVLIGIVTLLLVVPVPVAAIHQAGAVVVTGLGLWHLFGRIHPMPASATTGAPAEAAARA